MDIVTVVNRTSKPVEGIFDGQPMVIPPHGRKAMLSNAAELVKRQNPVMGSEDPTDPRSADYLLGVEEWGDDISPLEQSDAVERFDRSLVTDPQGQKAKPMDLHAKRGSRVKVAIDDDNPVGIQTV
jgi:hypothetical protein